MFLDTFVKLCTIVFSFAPEAPILSRDGGFVNNYHMSNYSALRDFYLLPLEIHENIKSKFIECIRLDKEKFNCFQSKCFNGIIYTRTCTKLPASESKIAWRNNDGDENDDIYVQYSEPYGSWIEPHYWLGICRCGMGEIKKLHCYYKDASLVTFKDNIVEVYHIKDKDNGYDIQTWYLDKQEHLSVVIQNLNCLQLVLVYNCFEYEKKVDPIPLTSPFRKIYDGIPAHVKKCIFIDEEKNI